MDKETAALVTNSSVQIFEAFVEEFDKESDRAAVILVAAKMDMLLFQILQKVLRPSTRGDDDLLDSDRPLGTFSAKIAACHRLGLIDDELCRALHLIRKIRNSFAHELSGVKLDNGSHRDRIHELYAPLTAHAHVNYLREQYFPSRTGPAADFRVVSCLILLRLEGAFDRHTARYSSNPQKLIFGDESDFAKLDEGIVTPDKSG